MDGETDARKDLYERLQKRRIYKRLGTYSGLTPLSDGSYHTFLEIVEPDKENPSGVKYNIFTIQEVIDILDNVPQLDEPEMTENDIKVRKILELGNEYNRLGTFLGFGVLGDIVNGGLENVFCYYFTGGSYNARNLMKFLENAE